MDTIIWAVPFEQSMWFSGISDQITDLLEHSFGLPEQIDDLPDHFFGLPEQFSD